MPQSKKKSNSVTITKSGKVKLRLTDLEAMDFKITLQYGADHINHQIGQNKLIDQLSYELHAGLALFHNLWVLHIAPQFDSPRAFEFTLHRHEALLLWGTIHKHCHWVPATTNGLMGKLHQTLT